MAITCLAILAVDFRVFPRRFAKVETWGTSLLDVGVGSFVFSAGVVASKAHLKARFQMEKQDPDHEPQDSFEPFGERMLLAIRHSLPLLVLGILRLVSVKSLEYAEHVSEYGVHWNFFFTIALLPYCLALLAPILSSPTFASSPIHGYTGLLLATAYEAALQLTPLKSWALTAPRTDLLSANKEGVVSSIGYLSIFLLGMETGSSVLPRFLHPTSFLFRTLNSLGVHPGNANPRNLLLASLALCTGVYVALLTPFLYAPALGLARYLSIPISRRLANLPYVLWIAAFNTGQILLFALVESLVFPSVFKASTPVAEKAAAEVATPQILEDFNNGGLLLFVLANLGTGLVNLGVDTLGMGNLQAVGILLVYMASLTMCARLLRGVKLKI